MTDHLVLKTAIGNYGSTRALKDGTVPLPGAALDFAEITPIYKAFGLMIRQAEFDVSEMAFTTYLLARHFGKPLTALPVVLKRIFHHGTIMCNATSGIREPKDLEGKRVGVRAYAQTGPTWSRGILRSEYGVDLGKVNWITFEGSHVDEYQDPDFVFRAPEGKGLQDMLLAGEIDAAISPNRIIAPEVKPLFADAADLEARWFQKTGIYPINHIVVVNGKIAAAHPEILSVLFDAFKKAKAVYLDRLEAQGPASAEDELQLRMMKIVGPDPLPCGVRPNRKATEAMAHFVFDQKMLPRLYSVEEIFDAAVRDFE